MREAENTTMHDYYAHEKEEDEKFAKLLEPISWPEDQRRLKLEERLAADYGWGPKAKELYGCSIQIPKGLEVDEEYIKGDKGGIVPIWDLRWRRVTAQKATQRLYEEFRLDPDQRAIDAWKEVPECEFYHEAILRFYGIWERKYRKHYLYTRESFYRACDHVSKQMAQNDGVSTPKLVLAFLGLLVGMFLV